MSPPQFDVFCDLLERLSIAFTANVNLYHLSKFSIYLSYIVHCNYTKIGKLTPILSIRIVLSCFYLPISHSENFSTWISSYPSALNAMLNLSITEQTHNNMEYICFMYKGRKWVEEPRGLKKKKQHEGKLDAPMNHMIDVASYWACACQKTADLRHLRRSWLLTSLNCI